MATYQIEINEDARIDLSYYTAFERKRIVSEIRDQLTHQPSVVTRNRKALRDNPIARWELRVDKFRVFYELDEESQTVVIVAVGHKDHEVLLIRGKKVEHMTTIHLDTTKVDLNAVIDMARREPVLLLTADGQEFYLSLADDFEREVESLRRSQAFQRFLDERSACSRRYPLEAIEAEIEQELASQREGV